MSYSHLLVLQELERLVETRKSNQFVLLFERFESLSEVPKCHYTWDLLMLPPPVKELNRGWRRDWNLSPALVSCSLSGDPDLLLWQ